MLNGTNNTVLSNRVMGKNRNNQKDRLFHIYTPIFEASDHTGIMRQQHSLPKK